MNSFESSGKFELVLRPGSTLRVVLASFGWWIVMVVLSLSLERVIVDHFGFSSNELRRAFLFLTFISAIALPALIARARQKRAALTWDEWGVTEWDGDGVRVAIPWDRLLFSVERALPRLPLTLTLSDGESRLIKVAMTMSTEGVRCRRRLHPARDDELLALIHAVEARGAGLTETRSFAEVFPERPDRLRRAEAIGFVLAATAPFIGAVMLESAPTSVLTTAVFALAALALTLRASRPARELAALLRRARRLRGASAIELVDSDGELLTARISSSEAGEQVQLDTTLMAHPDGRLAERRGRAYATLDRPLSAGSPYRGTSPAMAPALESAGARAARRRLTAAVMVEVAVRAGLVLLALVVTVGSAAEPAMTEEERETMRLQARCHDGDASDCAELSNRHAEEIGVEQDLAEAARLARMACDARYERGCFLLASAYEDGRGVEADPRQALELYERSCSRRTPESCVGLGRLLLRAQALPRDRARSCNVLERACLWDNEAGCTTLYRLIADGTCPADNRTLALRLYRQQCDRNDGTACYRLAQMHQSGQLTSAEPAGANELYRRACELDVEEACGHLDASDAQERPADSSLRREPLKLDPALEAQ